MSMKSATDPRRVYSRNDIVHVLTAGLAFGPKGNETKIKMTDPVKVEGLGDGTVRVSQRVGHSKKVSEVWGEVVVPCKPRG